MEVICLEEKAFYELVEHVANKISEKANHDWKWISTEEAMKLLNIKSKTTLQRMRNAGKIRFSQPYKRVILYDRDSLNEFLERHARETF